MKLNKIGLVAVIATGFAFGGAGEATSATAASTSAQALELGKRISVVSEQNITEVQRRRGRRYRRGRARRFGRRSYRRRGPGVGLYLSPFALGLGLGPRYVYPRRYVAPRRYAGSGRCSVWSQRCASNWGYGNSNYYGCLRYHGCR